MLLAHLLPKKNVNAVPLWCNL